MKALLTPHYQPELGLIILKPGTELLKKIGTSSRLIISPSTEQHKGAKSGILDEEQLLLNNKHIDTFLFNDKVIDVLKKRSSFDWWLANKYKCQFEDGDYCYHESVNEEVGQGAVRICCYHDKDFVVDDKVKDVANRNLKSFLIDSIISDLRLGPDHKLSIQELGWWSVINNLYDLIPENMARLLHNREIEVIKSVYRESELIASDTRSLPVLQNQINSAEQHLQVLTKPVKKIMIDDESPESFMLRPKLKRWECEKYTQWVKTQPCMCCGQPADDPHHIIGYGQGKMGGKAHDVFTLPLCRVHHNELHRDVEAWEIKYGSQIELLIKFLDRVFSMRVII